MKDIANTNTAVTATATATTTPSAYAALAPANLEQGQDSIGRPITLDPVTGKAITGRALKALKTSTPCELDLLLAEQEIGAECAEQKRAEARAIRRDEATEGAVAGDAPCDTEYYTYYGDSLYLQSVAYYNVLPCYSGKNGRLLGGWLIGLPADILNDILNRCSYKHTEIDDLGKKIDFRGAIEFDGMDITLKEGRKMSSFEYDIKPFMLSSAMQLKRLTKDQVREYMDRYPARVVPASEA